MSKHNKKVICPLCGGEVKYEDVFDQSYSDGVYVDDCVGTCEDCGQEVLWQEVFTFTRVERVRPSESFKVDPKEE